MRHQIWKKGTALTAAFALAVVPALAGCGSEQKEKAADSGKSGEQGKEKKEVAMGRYLEEDVTLPEGCGDITDMTMLEDGSLRVCYFRSGEGSFYNDSSDGGKTWGEAKNLAELLGIDPENIRFPIRSWVQTEAFFLPFILFPKTWKKCLIITFLLTEPIRKWISAKSFPADMLQMQDSHIIIRSLLMILAQRLWKSAWKTEALSVNMRKEEWSAALQY